MVVPEILKRLLCLIFANIEVRPNCFIVLYAISSKHATLFIKRATTYTASQKDESTLLHT